MHTCDHPSLKSPLLSRGLQSHLNSLAPVLANVAARQQTLWSPWCLCPPNHRASSTQQLESVHLDWPLKPDLGLAMPRPFDLFTNSVQVTTDDSHKSKARVALDTRQYQTAFAADMLSVAFGRVCGPDYNRSIRCDGSTVSACRREDLTS